METPNSLKSRPIYTTPEDKLTSSEPQTSTNKQTLSDTLRERLRKTRRSFTSPFSVAKRLKIDDDAKVEAVSPVPNGSSDKMSNDITGEKALYHTVKKHIASTEPLSVDTDTGEVISLRSQSVCLQALVDLPETELKILHDALKKEVQEQEETLRRLSMAKMYRAKNDLDVLQCLISKWRLCSQSVLYELQSVLPSDSSKLSLTQLIDGFGLDDKILHYDRVKEEFLDM
ncbi:swi5-dependent recombination DNA repair protein 1 homolog [Polypterus senegalus]|uniref:swi5-dependent recombination DNA repair protein 1 homolog n=1 Tax=Polypterus senegalus TaxID=55291 RepID=UPI00196585F7|nr:swi5-dependent recombination DNA repair protein 1 homolog [Polypterus senegalus]